MVWLEEEANSKGAGGTRCMYDQCMLTITTSTPSKPWVSNNQPIDETIFDDFPYLSPAQGCLPLAGTAIDLLVGYDHAYLITALHTISAPTNADRHPSAAYARLGWTIYGGMIPQSRAVVSNVSSVHHVRRLEEEDDLKPLFYSDVAGVKPTSACV